MRNAGTLILLPHTEFTSAIQLIIEIIFLDDLQATFLQTVLAPVMVPPDDFAIWRDQIYPQSAIWWDDLLTGPAPGFIDLIKRFPS